MKQGKGSPPRVYIETFGCQMNDYDSAQMLRLLAAEGYEAAAQPNEADVIVINTCSVRDKAEQKALSRIGRLKKLRKHNPDLKYVIAGCLAQRRGGALLHQMPYLHLVLGTAAVDRLPQHLRALERGARTIVDIEQEDEGAGACRDFGDIVPGKGSPVAAFTTVMKGCDNYCAYCIVPYVRGRERSRAPAEILREIGLLVAHGVREITLLGQNVNSYGQTLTPPVDFTELLRHVHEIEGLRRIRFTTSHPKDLDDRLIAAFAELPKLAGHIHLPVQSGSNRVLARMGRGYTIEQYLQQVRQFRQTRPEIALTSDILVGFPGESEEDFQQTLDLLESIRYSNAFSFRYSVRPGTAAAEFVDDVPEKEKIDRLMILQERQRDITFELHRALIGRTVDVLVEREQTDADKPRWSGKSGCYREVHFSGDGVQIGDVVTVKVEEAFASSLRGTATG